MVNLKEKLLATGYFLDNNYLEEYINLVTNNKDTFGYTEKHHILQKQYFKLANLPLDNSLNNIIELSYCDHCKAHWLLYFCTIGPLQKANAATVQYILNVYNTLNMTNKTKAQLTEADFKCLQEYFNSICEDPNSKYYSESEIAFIKKYYPEHGLNYCAKILDRTVPSISAEVIKLGLMRKTHWTNDDIQFLLDNYPIYGGPYCAEHLGRTTRVIFKKAMRLGLTRNSKKAVIDAWTEDEIILLKLYYPLEGSAVYKRFKNRSYNACRCMASKLKLKRKKNND